MNTKLVGYLTGCALILVSAAMGACSAFAMWGGTGLEEASAFTIGVALSLTAGLVLCIANRSARSDTILRRDAVAVSGIVWVVVSTFGAIPFVVSNNGLPLAAAFFESVSGFTTTGSTTIADLEAQPASILLWRALSQWVGGLGILVLFAALLPGAGIGGKSLMGSESSLDMSQSPNARVRDLAMWCWAVYIGLTLACVGSWFLLDLSGTVEVTFVETVLYSMTTVATGGFAPHNASVGHFGSLAVELMTIAFMIISSLSMILLVNCVRGRWSSSKAGRSEARMFLGIVAVAWIIVIVDMAIHRAGSGGIGAILRESLFPVVSMATSTGYGSSDYDTWPTASRCVIMILMMIGGCSGSTAGGMKVIRILIVTQTLRHELRKTYRPGWVKAIRADGKSIPEESQRRALCYLCATGVIIVLATLTVSMIEPGQLGDPVSAAGAVLGTFLNMGPGFGNVGPTDTYALLSSPTLLILSFLMLLGRLEIFVFLALLTRSFWSRG